MTAQLERVTIFVPCTLYSANQESQWHWTARSSHRKVLREAAHWAAKIVRPRPVATPPVGIEVTPHYRPSRRRFDAANVATTAKPCIDGLVQAGVLEDDNPEMVRWVRFHAGQRSTSAEGLLIELETLTP